MLLNNKLTIVCPDGFRQLSEAEIEKLNTPWPGSGTCLSDPERHMLLSFGWKKVNGLAAIILSTKDLAKNMEQDIAGMMKEYDFESAGYTERTICGKRAGGFRYSYTAQGVRMTAESLVLKSGKTLYYFHCYARKTSEAGNLAVWEKILTSVTNI